jgi:hypothetical protein
MLRHVASITRIYIYHPLAHERSTSLSDGIIVFDFEMTITYLRNGDIVNQTQLFGNPKIKLDLMINVKGYGSRVISPCNDFTWHIAICSQVDG